MLVLVRHGEREDYLKKKEWIDSAKKPWDTPLTSHGKEQAEKAGEFIKTKLEELGLPKATRIFSSPFTRCVETSVAMGKALGTKPKICIENAVCEAISEDFYRSWALSGKSDSTWGGPPGFTTGSGYENVKLRAQAHVPAAQLLNQVGDFDKSFGLEDAHVSVFQPGFTIEHPEDHDAMRARIGRFAAAVAAAFPNETVIICSHGGPLVSLFNYLTGERCRPLGFTAVSILQAAENSQTLDEGNPNGPGAKAFQSLVMASTEHLETSEDLGLQTAFSGKEDDTEIEK